MARLLDESLGTSLVGLIASSIIYGITCLQVFMYFTEYCAKDKMPLKSFVVILMVLDTVNLAFICHTVYTWAVTYYGDLSQLLREPWSILVQIPVGTFSQCMVQGFYAYRVYQLSGKKTLWIPSIIILLSVGQFVSALGLTISSFDINTIQHSDIIEAWTCGMFGTELLCDVAITIAMTYYLKKRQTVIRRTNRGINLLTTYFLRTGLLTSILAGVTMIAALASTKTLIFTPFSFTLFRLYNCSFLSILNSRSTVQGTMSGNGEPISLSQFTSGTGRTRPQTGSDAILFDIKQSNAGTTASSSSDKNKV